jgi:hypothetical protein
MWRYAACMHATSVVGEALSCQSVEHISIMSATTAQPADDLRQRTPQPHPGRASDAHGVTLPSGLKARTHGRRDLPLLRDDACQEPWRPRHCGASEASMPW